MKNAASKKINANYTEEFYALRKCAAEVIFGDKPKAVRKTRNGTFCVGMKLLDKPTLFLYNGQHEYKFAMANVADYFQYGHIKDIWEHQKDDALGLVFENIKEFLKRFNK